VTLNYHQMVYLPDGKPFTSVSFHPWDARSNCSCEGRNTKHLVLQSEIFCSQNFSCVKTTDVDSGAYVLN